MADNPAVAVTLNLTPEQINTAVVNAIVNSAIGKELHEAIARAVKQLGASSYWDSGLDKEVKRHIDETIRQRVHEVLKPGIEARVLDLMTGERLAPIIEAASNQAVERITKVIGERQW